ncbi:IBR domain-containing protein [Cephalotus follicularis]|uniref:RBR-type E3 ubiquitin transferase n=1 Tax=Cephalotus follicularis TaxID=3775 RepID=A0A1Q3BST1_CEPFO|nr:IBR domain-containing protein [Cephalotus follicularis]
MGNKLVVLVPKCNKLKKHKKQRNLSTTNGIPQQEEVDQVYFSPKSFFNGSIEAQQYDDAISGQPDRTDDIPKFVCEICVESQPLNYSLNCKCCSHFYCCQCIVNYVASKLDDNVIRISCPVSGCAGILEPEYCRMILPLDLFNRWGNALCESGIAASKKFYCPYKDCSILIVNDRAGQDLLVKEWCPYCRRALCLRCRVPWHSNFDCATYRKLIKRGGHDRLLMELAKKLKWRKCPKCKYYVEKSEGCFSMRCRYISFSLF